MSQHKVKDISVREIAQGENSRLQIHDDDLADLMESIKHQGLIHAITVVKIKPSTREGKKFKVIAGFRRLSAFKKLRRDTIPALIKTDITTPEEEIIYNLVENDLRKDIDMFEYGRYCQKLVEEGNYTIREAASSLHTNVSRIKDSIKIFKCVPPEFAGRIKALPAGAKNPRGRYIHPTKAKLAVEMQIKYKITQSQLSALLEQIGKDKSITNQSLSHAMCLMKLGYTLDAALKRVDKVDIKRFDLCISKTESKRLKSMHGSLSAAIQHILYGSGKIKDPRIGKMKNER